MTQNEALKILKTGGNVFLTGEPGSGKTHTVNAYVVWLRQRGIDPAITASTGIAATHIGGYTIHSWSGIGVRKNLSDYDLDAIARNKRVAGRVARARVLIIDEVSMLSANTLTMVNTICREIRRNQKPFGGLQAVLVGDFFQLPPVNKRENDEEQQRLSLANEQMQFAFASPAWKTLNPLVCYLSEQHRQEDVAFLKFLSAIRTGEVSESHRALLRTRYARVPKNGITQLYSHNEDVNRINEAELAKLPGQAEVFEMQCRGPQKIVAALKRGCLSPELLSLKIGARVMFTKNDVVTRKFVNGTLATVIGFEKEMGYPVVKTRAGQTLVATPMEWSLEDGGRILARITQIPLRLAWALTVHKSQGMSLDAAHMDLSSTFEYGQGYVALSRVRTLAGLSLAGLNKRALEVHPDIRIKDREFREQSYLAREKFEKTPVKEIEALHYNFIRACGGKMSPTGTEKQKIKKIPTHEVTRTLLLKKLSLADIAKERGMTVGTIVSHLEQLCTEKKIIPARDLEYISRGNEETVMHIHAVIEKVGADRLKPIFQRFGGRIPYDTIRLARLLFEK